MDASFEGGISDFQWDFNKTLEINQLSEMVTNFYKDMNKEMDYVLIILYIPLIGIALIANFVVIVIIVKYQHLRSVTNYFVMNLSIADLLVTTICMPMAVSQAVSIAWMYGEITCKLFFYLQGVAVAASVFTITAMSIDRYLAIRNPIIFRRVINRRNAIVIIISVWLVSFGIFGPILKAVTLQKLDLMNITLIDLENSLSNIQLGNLSDLQICVEDSKLLGSHGQLFGTTCFIVVYAIPGFMIIISYSLMGRTLCARKLPFDCDSTTGSTSSRQGSRLIKERRRVAWILLTLAIIFAFCWLPYNVLRLLIDLSIIAENKIISTILSYCLFFGHTNSAFNPIVYCFMTRNFRRIFSERICKFCKPSRRSSHNKVEGRSLDSLYSGIAAKRNNLDLGTSRKFKILNTQQAAGPRQNTRIDKTNLPMRKITPGGSHVSHLNRQNHRSRPCTLKNISLQHEDTDKIANLTENSTNDSELEALYHKNSTKNDKKAAHTVSLQSVNSKIHHVIVYNIKRSQSLSTLSFNITDVTTK